MARIGNVGERLRLRRAELRVSQLVVALAAGINPTRLWRIENGYRKPTVEEENVLRMVLKLVPAENEGSDEARPEERQSLSLCPWLPVAQLFDQPVASGREAPREK